MYTLGCKIIVNNSRRLSLCWHLSVDLFRMNSKVEMYIISEWIYIFFTSKAIKKLQDLYTLVCKIIVNCYRRMGLWTIILKRRVYIFWNFLKALSRTMTNSSFIHCAWPKRMTNELSIPALSVLNLIIVINEQLYIYLFSWEITRA